MKRIALFPLLIVSLAACDLLGGDDPGSDPNKPSVTSLSPEDGAQDVPLNATMSATLELPNTGVDATTLGNGTVRLTQAGEDVPVVTEDPVLAGDNHHAQT